ncbi:Pentatricopeptide repeat-containing protein 1, mitochondrial [Folsomia candida]|uniref:Pentatricopeptide repeat-containing protein 1, mitochondrial n=1 Tax=Folsomia candida TaxID=158441 RepID=A0A226DRJ1_FOLCA|nr:Pentatricopeptide repeat-containing protein 1, mitochondrial [Folsomia candida]
MNQLRASLQILSSPFYNGSLLRQQFLNGTRNCSFFLQKNYEGSSSPNLKQIYILRSFSSSQEGDARPQEHVAETSSHDEPTSFQQEPEETTLLHQEIDPVAIVPKSTSRPPAQKEDPNDPASITQRLIQLSTCSPEDYTPSAKLNPDLLKKAKSRYREVLQDYKNNFSRNEFLRQRMNSNNSSYRPRFNNSNYGNNPTWRNSNRNEDYYDDHNDGGRRWFSTSSPRGDDDAMRDRMKQLTASMSQNKQEATEHGEESSNYKYKKDRRDEEYFENRGRSESRQKYNNTKKRPLTQRTMPNYDDYNDDDGHGEEDAYPRRRSQSQNDGDFNDNPRPRRRNFSENNDFKQRRNFNRDDENNHNFDGGDDRRNYDRGNNRRNFDRGDDRRSFDRDDNNRNFNRDGNNRNFDGDDRRNFNRDGNNRNFDDRRNSDRGNNYGDNRRNSWSEGGNRQPNSYNNRSQNFSGGGGESGRYNSYNNNNISHYDDRRRREDHRAGPNYNKTLDDLYERKIRKTTDDEIRFQKYGRNYEEIYDQERAKLKAYKDPNRFDKKSTAVIGDYSKFTSKTGPTTTTTSSSPSSTRSSPSTSASTPDASLDLSSLLSHTDADTFGTLSLGPVPVKDYVGTSLKKELLSDSVQLGLVDNIYDDDAEGDDSKFLPAREDKWTMLKLSRRVKLLVDEMKVKEAVDTVQSALAQGGFQYSHTQFVYIYNLLISSCAQVGYVQMAFKMFNDMKKRGFKPKESTYTSLFNACSNSTWDAENNIKRMGRLREAMGTEGSVVTPNQIVYHAMIKGYGRNGDIESAFGVVDEMISLGQYDPNTETFNMLLQACITNTENGFRHVLVTWRKMHAMQIRADIYTFNLLLRAVRECGILPEPAFIEAGAQNVRKKKADDETGLLLPPVTTLEESDDMLNLLCLNDANSLDKINQRMLTTNQIVEQEVRQFSYIDLIEALKLPQNRLIVFGGLRGFLQEMVTSRDLVMMMKTYKLNPDITFFNLMLKRYYDGNNSVGAKKLLACFPQFNLTPNIMTWGVSATACKSKKMASELLAEMDAANFTPNIQIMGALLTQASRAFDPAYVFWVMEEANRREIKADTRFVLNIEDFKEVVRKGIINKEMGKPVTPPKLALLLEDMDTFTPLWTKFGYRYASWMKKTPVAIEPKDPFQEDFESFRKNKTHGTVTKEMEDQMDKKSDEDDQSAINNKNS